MKTSSLIGHHIQNTLTEHNGATKKKKKMKDVKKNRSIVNDKCLNEKIFVSDVNWRNKLVLHNRE